MSVITNKMNEKITGQRVAFAGCMASGKSYAAKFLQENWEEKTHILSLSTPLYKRFLIFFIKNIPFFFIFHIHIHILRNI